MNAAGARLGQRHWKLAERAGPWVVLACALFLRLWHIDLTRFSNEAVWLLQGTNDFITTGHIPLHGALTFSIGAWEPPLITFLLAPLALVSRDPLWISVGLAVIDATGSVFLFWAARRLTSSAWTGVAAGLAYAVAPGALIYGRMVWNLTLVPVLAAVALWGLIEFRLRKRSWALAVSLAAIGAAAQLHFANGVYILPWLAVAVAGWNYVRWRDLGAAAALLAAVLAPYLVLQLRTGWADAQFVYAFLKQPKHIDLQALDTAGALMGSATFWRFLPTVTGFPRFDFDGLTWMCIGLTCAGFVYALAARRLCYSMVAAWLALPLLFTLRHSVEVMPYYLLGQVPAACLLQGLALSRLTSAARRLRLPRTMAMAATAAVPAAGAGLLIAAAALFVQFQAQLADTVRLGTFGIPLRYWMDAASALRSTANHDGTYVAEPLDVGMILPYLTALPSYRYYSGRQVVALPSVPSWYLAHGDTLASRFLLDRVGAPRVEIVTPRGAMEFGLFRVPGARAILAGPGFTTLKASIGGEIAVEGYVARGLAAGQSSPVDLLWRVLDGPRLADQHLSQFVHLVDGAGQVWSTNADLWNINEPWSSGDLVVSPIELNVRPDAPLGGYWLEVGFYDTFSARPLPITQNGRPLGGSLRIGPFRVGGVAAAPKGPPLGVFGENELALLHVEWQGDDVAIDWQALTKLRASYTVFVHAIDGRGKVVAGQDTAPRSDSYPTSLWEAGDVVHDTYHLGMKPSPGVHLEIGLYTQPAVRRLPLRRAGQPSAEDHLEVASPL